MGPENSHRIKRHESWPARLSQFLHDRRDVPFAWGLNDCLTFGADAVAALTGHDFAAQYRGTYHSQDEAKKLLDRLTSAVPGVLDGTVYGAVRSAFGKSPGENILMAGRGDIVLAEFRDSDGQMRWTCGIVTDTGRQAAFVAEERGLFFVPLKFCKYFWSY